MGSEEVTAADREKAFRILMPRETTPGMGYADLTGAAQAECDRIAAALADERAKARAPFLEVAERFTALADTTEARVSYDDRAEYRADQLGLAMGYTRAALAIRRAAEDPREVRET